MTAVDVAFTDARSGLARAISVERAFQEAARQLRGRPGVDAIAIAVASSDAAHPRLAYQARFADHVDELEADLDAEWRGPLADDAGDAIRRVTPRGMRISCAIRGDAVWGVVTALTDVAEDSPALESIEAAVRVVAGELATALDRADAVQRFVRRARLDASGEVAAGVAHELRNPVFGISSAVQLLRFRVRDDPIVEKNVGRILRDVERLGAMSAALLEYGRLAPVRLQPGDPDAVWDGVLDAQRGTLETRAIAVRRTRVEAPVPLAIDAGQLAQVFTQVLQNAAEAAPEGSDVTLSSASTPSGGWRCRLHNEGAALSADVIGHAFDLFFSTKSDRIGMGLPLSERIVEGHGGHITLGNASGGGVDLDIALPAAVR